ncbi:MAG: penicillin-binding protein 2 [Alphaproteobacteria bacterium]|nr:penicillin-binding protein 2 [Alphaproteobacteria bacterium]
MRKKYFFHKEKSHFYQPGEEIRVNRKNQLEERDSLNSVKSRVVLAAVAFCCVYLVLVLRLFDLCVLKARENSAVYNYSQDEEFKHILKYTEMPIMRADILDRNGTIIATSLPTVHLYANPSKIRHKVELAHKLAKIIPDVSYESFLKKLEMKARFVYLKRNLTPSQQYQINALGNPWLEFEKSEKRIYPHKNLFAHIIGATNIDNDGVSGLEKQLNSRLTESDIPLQLTIDSGLQDTIREELLQAVEKFHAEGASAILMDVRNGEILAMLSLPDYDPNSNNNISERAQFNFTTKGVYEPGSVLKIFNAALGLESGKVKVTDKFDATQPLKLRYNVIKDYRGENRWLDLPEIMIHSSNIGSARIALKVGKDEQRRFLESLGFFAPVKSIEVAEKGIPLIPSYKNWGESTVATVGYGYGISITPLHLISAFASVVNGGMYYEPTLVKNNKNTTSHRTLSYNTSMQMRQLLRGVVVKGSGKRANVAGYEVAGKTGTANKPVNGHYVDKKVYTSFLATFPVSDPKYALYLMLDEPKPIKETWGFVTSGWNTVPTAGKIITAIAPQLDLPANNDIYESRHERIINAAYTVRKNNK